MPIYMHVKGLDGDVTAEGGASGGVWKTSNFLTRDAGVSGSTARPKIKVFVCPSDTSVVQISRISLSPNGVGGLDARDAWPTRKAAELFNAARSMGPGGRLYLATNVGVFSKPGDAQGRLLIGTDSGVWRSGVSETARRTNNLHQIGIGAHNVPVVEILVSDVGAASGRIFRLRDVTISPATMSTQGRGVFTLSCSRIGPID